MKHKALSMALILGAGLFVIWMASKGPWTEMSKVNIFIRCLFEEHGQYYHLPVRRDK